MICTPSIASPTVSVHIGPQATTGLPYAQAHWFYREFASSQKKIERALQQAEVDPGEAMPSIEAIAGIVRLVEIASKTTPFSEAETSVFCGEAIVTWRSGAREISLISRGNPDEPKLLRYRAGENEPSQSGIKANATPDDLRKAVRWLSE